MRLTMKRLNINAALTVAGAVPVRRTNDHTANSCMLPRMIRPRRSSPSQKNAPPTRAASSPMCSPLTHSREEIQAKKFAEQQAVASKGIDDQTQE